MGRKAETFDRDRYLTLRNGVYSYKRRVPSRLQDLDKRFPTIRLSLQTRDLADARRLRDAYEKAADELWGSDRKSTRELQSLMRISYAVFCLKKKNDTASHETQPP